MRRSRFDPLNQECHLHSAIVQKRKGMATHPFSLSANRNQRFGPLSSSGQGHSSIRLQPLSSHHMVPHIPFSITTSNEVGAVARAAPGAIPAATTSTRSNLRMIFTDYSSNVSGRFGSLLLLIWGGAVSTARYFFFSGSGGAARSMPS